MSEAFELIQWGALALCWGAMCALVGVVYAYVLAQEDTPLNGWFRGLAIAKENESAIGPTRWFASILGACEKCFSGQLALWSSSLLIKWAWSAPSLTVHVLSACSAVLCAMAMKQAARWLKNRI
jgi:hypothetical protein